MLHIRKILLILLGAFILISPLSAAENKTEGASIKEIQKETQDLMQSFKSYTIDKKDKAVKNAKAAINELDKNIDQLENNVDKRWDSMTSTAKKEAREDLKGLRKIRNDLAENYGSLKASSKDAWGDIKSGFITAYEKLANSWKKAEQEFNSNQ